LERIAVVRPEQIEAEGLGVVAPHQVLDGERVAERLRHLLGGQVPEAVVRPLAHEGPPGRGLRLRDLVLVVREDEILAAAVHVEGLAEVLHRHRGALDMPAGPAVAPRALPAGPAWLVLLPEGEVERVALAVVHLHARARLQVLPGSAPALAVA